MMKLFLFLALACAPVLAQPSLVNVQDTVYTQFGALYSGTLGVSLSNGLMYSGTGPRPVLSIIQSMPIASGNLNITLAANSGTYYQLRFDSGARLTCVFPATSATVTLSQYCSGTGYYTTLASLGAATLLNLNGALNSLFH